MSKPASERVYRQYFVAKYRAAERKLAAWRAAHQARELRAAFAEFSDWLKSKGLRAPAPAAF